MQNRSLSALGIFLTLSWTTFAAELVKVSDQPVIPKSIGLEMNHGQSKGEVLFLHRSDQTNVAVTPQAILYSPLNTQLKIVGGEANPLVTYGDTVQNAVNVYHGADESKWLTGIPVHGWARLNNVYPGISLEYKPNAAGQLVMKWIIQPEGDPEKILLDFENAVSLQTLSDGTLSARFVNLMLGSEIRLIKPVATQGSGEQVVNRSASFKVLTTTSFGLAVEGRDPSLPLEIEIPLSSLTNNSPQQPKIDADGNFYLAEILPDAAGIVPPFPDETAGGCGRRQWSPIACTDVAITKFSSHGTLLFRTYLSGNYSEIVHSLNLRKDGNLTVSGAVDSPNFPVGTGAYQTTYAGPAPTYGGFSMGVKGNAFVSTLDHTNGHLIQSTYLGGSEPALLNRVSSGEDDSVYLISHQASDQLPVTGSPLQSTCPDPCRNGYVAKLNADLSQLTYATYLPGTTRKTYVHSDGSLYFGGAAEPGFPTTPDAYQQIVTERKGFLAKIRPDGAGLTFGTYYDKSSGDGILDLAVPQDGSVWALAAKQDPVFAGEPAEQYLIRLSADGTKLLHEAEVPSSTSLTVDKTGSLMSISNSPSAATTATPNSLLSQSCGSGVFTRRNSSGEVTFSTYLPAHYTLAGVNETNELLLRNQEGSIFKLRENGTLPHPFAGCVVDGAQFSAGQPLAAGEIVSIFGKHMGPEEGVAFELVNDKLPTTLGETQVLVNGEPAPLLYVSATQINLVLPFSLESGSKPTIQVITPPTVGSRGIGNEISSYSVDAPSIRTFQIYGEEQSLAAALNQDGSVNSRENPAVLGSVVALFATGGGQTEPASMAGEVTPLTLYPLAEKNISARIDGALLTRPLEILYVGGAPGLVAGVNQINVRLPAELPESMTRDGVLYLTIQSPGGTTTAIVAAKQPE